jgi:hypothetical protein
MKLGDQLRLDAGKWCTMYLVTSITPSGITLRRVTKAKTKADSNRFNDTILISYFGNVQLDNPHIKE